MFSLFSLLQALTQVENIEGVCADPAATSCAGESGELPQSFLLPSRVRGVVSSGGGVSFGYEES